MNSVDSGSGNVLVNLLNGVTEEQVSIYALWENGEVVYVGSAIDPWKRFASHCRNGFKDRSVSLEILCWVNAERRNSVEQYAIKAAIRWGFPIENIVWTGDRNGRV